MKRIFGNPGSTEVPFLSGLPDDFDFVLALHEGSVIAMATGYAIATGGPAFALLHTTAGLGNAVGAIATARVNRAPLVIMVGQQDRRHLALEPFLAGRLRGLAGDYPLEVIEPVRAADVPSAIQRAALVAGQGSGPVLLIVPMDDWEAAAEDTADSAAARVAVGPRGVPEELAEIATALAQATSPALVAGAGNDSDAGWRALAGLAERIDAPVWIEPFGARVGFAQDHRLYRGQLPFDRTGLRETLAGVDVLVVVGAAAIRQYPFVPGNLIPDGARLFVLTEDPAEANRSPAQLAVVGDLPTLLDAMTEQLPPVTRARPPVDAGSPPAREQQLRAEHVFGMLADHLPADTILLEESPSSRPAMQAMVPARRPLGFVSAAMGGLGFAMPAGIGFKMGLPARPVIVVVGDGSSMYSIQSLWSAAQESAGVLFLVLANGGYAIMDRLMERRGGERVWPSLADISVTAIARGFGVEAERIDTYDALESVLSKVCPDLAARNAPLLLEVAIAPG